MKQKQNSQLKISDLHVSVENKEIIHGLNLTINAGELHAIMGPNGSGKSTLTYALMGHPNFIVKGKILLNGVNLLKLTPDKRAKLGIILAFQNPLTIPGVSITNFLRTAYREIYKDSKFDAVSFHHKMTESAQKFGLKDLLKRAVNDGFSGGEKKKLEMLQLALLKPKFAIFDEIDTGLDIDSLKFVSEGINELQRIGSGILLITHYQRILNYVNPQYVHIMKEGRLVKEGGLKIVKLIEEQGYAAV